MPSYILSREAELDLEDIAEYSIKKHGESQMLKYIGNLEDDAEKLSSGILPFKTLVAINPNLRMKKSGKHYIFGLMQDNAPMIVVAFLHERMEILQRLKNRLD